MITEFTFPKGGRNLAPRSMINELLLGVEHEFNTRACKSRMWPFPSHVKNQHWTDHKQAATGLRGKWPTREQLVLLNDPNVVSKKDLSRLTPSELQDKRRNIRESELDRLRKQCSNRCEEIRAKTALSNQRAFENWLKGKVKARKDEALRHLKLLKLEEERKSLFAEYTERRNIDEVHKWLKNKMNLVDDVVTTKTMSKEMQKWYEAQKASMRESLLKMWGYEYYRKLPKVDPSRTLLHPEVVTDTPKIKIVSSKSAVVNAPKGILGAHASTSNKHTVQFHGSQQ